MEENLGRFVIYLQVSPLKQWHYFIELFSEFVLLLMLLQILNLKPHVLPHKPRPGLNDSSSNLCPSTAKTRKEDRKVEENFSSFGSHFLTVSPPGLMFYFLFFQMYVRESAAPYVSMAEMMKKFLSNTREMSLSRMSSSLSQVNLLLFRG